MRLKTKGQESSDLSYFKRVLKLEQHLQKALDYVNDPKIKDEDFVIKLADWIEDTKDILNEQ